MSLVSKLLSDCAGAIRRGIIPDDQFKVEVSLVENALDGGAQAEIAVINGQHDRNDGWHRSR